MKMGEKIYKERLLANSRTNISRYTLSFLALFQNIYVIIQLFLSESLTTFCGALRFHETLLDNQWTTLSWVQRLAIVTGYESERNDVRKRLQYTAAVHNDPFSETPCSQCNFYLSFSAPFLSQV